MSPTRFDYNVNVVPIGESKYLKDVLNLAGRDGWELVTIVPLPLTEPGVKPFGTVVWRRRAK